MSPTWQMVVMARNCADMPEETATAPTPPSSAATRFSNTSFVGFWRGRREGTGNVSADEGRWNLKKHP